MKKDHGGAITAPRGGFYDRNGEWAVEKALRQLDERDWPELLRRPDPPVRVKQAAPADSAGRGGS